MLYPQANESRHLICLDGLWRFLRDPENSGPARLWHETLPHDAGKMPVPSSINELETDKSPSTYCGVMWYETETWIPAGWHERRIRLRVGAAAHRQTAYCNGAECGSHQGGFLPFDVDLTSAVHCGAWNRITLRIDSSLNWNSLPPGVAESTGEMPAYQRHHQRYFHDFYNFSGIHRSVYLYSTEMAAIEQISTHPVRVEGNPALTYSIQSTDASPAVQVTLRDDDEKAVAQKTGAQGCLVVPDGHLWSPQNPYLYTLEVQHPSGDRYRLRTGIRFVEISGKQLLLNGNPVYLRGFGKHEDSDIIGKAHSDAVMVKDFSLLDWIGANSFRTSHYPYAEEVLDYADEQGVLVIGELPAVGFNFSPRDSPFFAPGKIDDSTRRHHLATLEEMLARDAHHPSIISWSLTNEPASQEEASRSYFEPIVQRARELDTTRPLMFVMSAFPQNDHIGDLVDWIGVNRYYGWYHDCGDLESIVPNLTAELRAWWNRYGKPIVMTEYGADAIAGLHRHPPAMFSEEFQCDYLNRVHQVLDSLDFIVGEHVWNFADFATAEGLKRIGGNCKGIFTRQRQPKMAAHFLRKRWKGV